MRTICVDPHSIPFKSYQTADEAFLAEERSAHVKRAQIDTSRVHGEMLEQAVITEHRIRLFLTNGHVIDVTAVKKRIEWQICRTADVDLGAELASPLQLVWPDGHASLWDPWAVLRSRLHFPIRLLNAPEPFFSVYFEGGGSLMFSLVWNVTEAQPLIMVGELEEPTCTV